MNILGLTGFAGTGSHDAAAALVRDGVVVAAAEEERFRRMKHAWGLSPVESADYCLRSAGLQLSDVDAVAYGWNIRNERCSLHPRGQRGHWARTMLPQHMFPVNEIPPIYFIKHHVAHIAGAFYASGFEDAACVCVDGQGEAESITLAMARRGSLEIIKTYGIQHSLGAMYEAATYYCGLGYHAPGKLMGLASYGRARHKIPLDFRADTGEFELHLNCSLGSSATFSDVRDAYVEYFTRSCYPFKTGSEHEAMAYIHVAASVQYTLQALAESLARYLKTVFHSNNLVVCGGVALNCTCNGSLERSGIFRNVYVPPGANDASCSMGAAMEVFRMHGAFNHKIPPPLLDARLGPSFSNAEIEAAFCGRNLKAERYEDEELYRVVANALFVGNIAGWFQGKGEFGPRALGARSILASPCSRQMNVRVNLLKRRELWRPLSPSILAERYGDYYDDQPGALASFMLKATPTKPSKLSEIPAVVHVDGSSRPQSVDRLINPRYYNLIATFEKISGIPIVMNTSLNFRGEPIVNTPGEAIDLFLRSDAMDIIAIGNYVYSRNDYKKEETNSAVVVADSLSN